MLPPCRNLHPGAGGEGGFDEVAEWTEEDVSGDPGEAASARVAVVTAKFGQVVCSLADGPVHFDAFQQVEIV